MYSKLVDHVNLSPSKTSPRNHEIDTITIHCVVGQCTVESLGAHFAPASRQASSNYGIGYDGRIGCYVEEEDRSWCSGNRENDHRAITIEVASDTTPPYAVTEAAYESLLNLVEDICRRYNIKLNYTGDESGNMTMHKWFQATACPGDYLISKYPDIQSVVNDRIFGEKNVFYRVQVGAFNARDNAEAMKRQLLEQGYDAFVVEVSR